MKNTCCVPNCESRRSSVKLHRFPKTEIGLKWVTLINCARLKELGSDELHKFFVCHKHFEKRFVTGSLRLHMTAYPTLFTNKEMESGIPAQAHEHNENMHPQSEHSYSRKRHFDHTYMKRARLTENIVSGSGMYHREEIVFNLPICPKNLPSRHNPDLTNNMDSPGPASCTTAEYEFHHSCTKLLPQDLEIEQCEAMDTDYFYDAPLSPDDKTPTPPTSSLHHEHHGISFIKDQQTVQNNQSTGTTPQDSSLLDDDPIRDLGIGDFVSELLDIASEHPALRKIEVDEDSIERVERDQCAALYMELLERICDAFDRIPRFVKDNLPGYDEKVYAQMVQLKIKLKIVIKPLVQECVRVDDPLAVEEHCSDVSKLYGDSTCNAGFQEAEKSNFAEAATSNQATVCLEDDQEIVEIEYLEDIQETDEIENLQDSRSILKHIDIQNKEYLENKLSKKPENTAYKVRTHPSSSVHSDNIYRNLAEPYILLEDCRRSSNTLHDTALNRNLRGKPTRFIMEDDHPESSYLSSTAESPHKYKVKMKYDILRKELNS